jgi:hypothetical protein
MADGGVHHVNYTLDVASASKLLHLQLCLASSYFNVHVHNMQARDGVCDDGRVKPGPNFAAGTQRAVGAAMGA